MKELNKKIDKLFDDDIRVLCVDGIDSNDVLVVKNAIKELVVSSLNDSLWVLNEVIADGQAPPHITEKAKKIVQFYGK